jgi:hypothetical protein
MSKLSVAWFEEDRAKYKGQELKEQTEATEKAVRANTVVTSRLKVMIEKDIEATYKVEEDFDDPAWERKTIAAAAERKVLRRYLKLLP